MELIWVFVLFAVYRSGKCDPWKSVEPFVCGGIKDKKAVVYLHEKSVFLSGKDFEFLGNSSKAFDSSIKGFDGSNENNISEGFDISNENNSSQGFENVKTETVDHSNETDYKNNQADYKNNQAENENNQAENENKKETFANAPLDEGFVPLSQSVLFSSHASHYSADIFYMTILLFCLKHF